MTNCYPTGLPRGHWWWRVSSAQCVDRCTGCWEVNPSGSLSFLPGVRWPGRWVGNLLSRSTNPSQNLRQPNPQNSVSPKEPAWGWRKPVPCGLSGGSPALPKAGEDRAFLNSSVGWSPGNHSLLFLSMDLMCNNLSQVLTKSLTGIRTMCDPGTWRWRKTDPRGPVACEKICSGLYHGKSWSAGMKITARFYYSVNGLVYNL